MKKGEKERKKIEERERKDYVAHETEIFPVVYIPLFKFLNQ